MERRWRDSPWQKLEKDINITTENMHKKKSNTASAVKKKISDLVNGCLIKCN